MSAAKQWGQLCPEGHGVLISRDDWTRQGVIWCPSEEHGGNGRFYRLTEVQEGWFDPSGPRVKSEWQLEQDARAAKLAEERIMAKEQAKAAPKAAPRAKRVTKAAEGRQPKECLCGCGGMTKGGRFLPGHDAKYHSALAKASK